MGWLYVIIQDSPGKSIGIGLLIRRSLVRAQVGEPIYLNKFS